MTPASGEAGTELTVYSCDFGDLQLDSFVSFGRTCATEYTKWTDGEIGVRVPEGVLGEMEVTVQTSNDASNPLSFTVMENLTINSVNPDRTLQRTAALSLVVSGRGFIFGTAARLERDGAVMEDLSCTVASGKELSAVVSLLGAEPGAYDVVVVVPDGREAHLTDGFTVDPACGAGSEAALPALGISLGFMSLAAARRRRRG